MSKATTKTEKAEITYREALNALNAINPIQQQQHPQTGQIQHIRVSSDLAKAKGETGTHVYHVKHDLKDAVKALVDREQNLNEERNKLIDKVKEIKASLSEKEIEEYEKTWESIAEQLNKVDAKKRMEDASNYTFDEKKGTITFTALKFETECSPVIQGLIQGEINFFINNLERDRLFKEKVTVKFTKGKLPISKIQQYVNSDEIEALDFAIELEEVKRKAS